MRDDQKAGGGNKKGEKGTYVLLDILKTPRLSQIRVVVYQFSRTIIYFDIICKLKIEIPQIIEI